MRAVDTNVLVRLLTRDDAGQVAIVEAFVASGAWVRGADECAPADPVRFEGHGPPAA